MSAEFLRREWGAVTFVLAVAVGVVVVPLALYFGNHGPSALAPTSPAASSASSASSAR